VAEREGQGEEEGQEAVETEAVFTTEITEHTEVEVRYGLTFSVIFVSSVVKSAVAA
jgi:hypothetical protein